MNYLVVGSFVIFNIFAAQFYNGVFNIMLVCNGKIRIPGKTMFAQSAFPTCQETLYQMNKIVNDDPKVSLSDIVELEHWWALMTVRAGG